MSKFPQPVELTSDVFEALETKAQQPPGNIAILGVMAGIYIGLGGIAATVALAGSDAMAFGAGQILAGLVFSLGLAAVVIVGGELFTGNTLFAGPVLAKKISPAIAARALVLAYLGNLVGSLLLAFVVFGSGFHTSGDGAVGTAAVELAVGKTEKNFLSVLASGVLANMLVCLGVWFALAGQTVTQKIVGLVLPVTVFVAAGFEHSVANMYLLPYAFLVEYSVGASALAISDIWTNILAATIGNIVGGCMIGIAYGLIFQSVTPKS